MILRLLCYLLSCVAIPVYAVDADALLPPDQAFALTAELKHRDTMVLSWDIAGNYYLYRHKFNFVSLTPGIKTGEPFFPAGQIKNDPFFDSVEIYRDHVQVRLPLLHHDPQTDDLILEIYFQGCADAGVCYMPIKKTVHFNLGFGTLNKSGSSKGSYSLLTKERA